MPKATTASEFLASGHRNKNPLRIIGIDVSKKSLEVAFSSTGTTKSYSNTNRGIQSLISAITKAKPRLVVFEPTGGYEVGLLLQLLEHRIPFHRVDPVRARALATAVGRRAKTDKIDARMLAKFGETLEPTPFSRDDRLLLDLRGLVLRRDQLVQDRVRQLGYRESAMPSSKRDIEEVIEFLEDKIKHIEGRINAFIKSNDTLREKRATMESIKGVGPTISAVLLAHMPELGNSNRKQIVALAGLAPYARDSGDTTGKRFIRGGRPAVRRALYMAALVASNSNLHLQTYYQKLISTGKAPKVALVAVARKLLVIVNAMVKHNRHWKEPAPALSSS